MIQSRVANESEVPLPRGGGNITPLPSAQVIGQLVKIFFAEV